MNTLMSVAAVSAEFSQRAPSAAAKQSLVPAVVLGGGANALSAVRSLGRAGVPVYILNEAEALVRHSRFGRWLELPAAASAAAAWTDFLLGPASDSLGGAVLLACCDSALDILARHRVALAEKFTLDDAHPEAHLAMLNKVRTYQIATAAGIATPRFRVLAPGQGLESLVPALPYPLIVKPAHTHIFRQRFGKKFVIVDDYASLQEAYQLVRELEMEVMLVEFIPGPDDQLCSYYTYLDQDAVPLVNFTKRVIRRHPPVVGNGCYHVTDWDPEVAAAGLAFLQAARVHGLGNVEFKRDPRDGKLKLIECNARLTEANCLVAAAGLDLPLFVYNRLTGRHQLPVTGYQRGLRLWYPVDDFHAFRQLHKEGRLSWHAWLRSIAHAQTFPYFCWYDPWPSAVKEWRRWRAGLSRRMRLPTTSTGA